MVAAAGLHTSSKLSVLVVDDEWDILRFFEDFLSGEGFEVTTVSDPTFVVRRLRDEVFHLVLLDVMMPKLSGLDLLALIRAFDDDIAVIMIASAASLETASASLQLGVSAYIEIPIELVTFRDTLARIMNEKGFVPRYEDSTSSR